jgi:flavodoxin/DNA-binding CsgD family transcriptional regulator
MELSALSMSALFKTNCVLVLACLCLRVSAQHYPEHLLFKDFATEYDSLVVLSDRLFEIAPQQAPAELEKLAAWAEQKGDIGLKYGFRLMRSRWQLDNNVHEEQTGEELRKIISRLTSEKIHAYNAVANQLLATWYWNRSKYADAFQYYFKANELYQPYTIQEFPPKANYLAHLGGRFYYFKDFKTAGHYFIEAIENKGENDIGLLNTIGLCFLFVKQYDSASLYYNKAIVLAEKKQSLEWVGIISGNLGHLFHVQGKLEEAEKNLQKEITLYTDLHQGGSSNVAMSYASLSEIALQKNDKAAAMKWALLSYQMAKEKNDIADPSMQRIIYPVLAHAYAANGNTTLAYTFAKAAGKAKDSIAAETNALVVAGAQNILQAQQKISELDKLEKDHQVNIILRDALLVMIVLIILITFLLVNRQRIKTANMQQLLEAQKLQAEAELKHATLQLKSFTQSISEKNELIQKFSAEMQRIPGVVYESQPLVSLQQSTILSDKEWQEFQEMFEKVHEGYLQRLTEKLKGLSPVDTRFILLSKLNLTINETAAMLGISADAVKANKERIRTKLRLGAETTLQSFAEAI